MWIVMLTDHADSPLYETECFGPFETGLDANDYTQLFSSDARAASVHDVKPPVDSKQRLCNCADPENCTEKIPGRACKKEWRDLCERADPEQEGK